MNTSSDYEVNSDEVSPDPPTNDVNINDNYDDGVNYYEVTYHTPTNDGNNETIDNYEENNNE